MPTIQILQEWIPIIQIIGTGGIVWLTWRIARLEKMLGNGTPGVFPRRAEVQAMIEAKSRTRVEGDQIIQRLEDNITTNTKSIEEVKERVLTLERDT